MAPSVSWRDGSSRHFCQREKYMNFPSGWEKNSQHKTWVSAWHGAFKWWNGVYSVEWVFTLSAQHAVMLKCFRFFFVWFAMLIRSPTARYGRCVCTCGFCVRVSTNIVVEPNAERPLFRVMNVWCWHCYCHSELRSIRPTMSESVIQKAKKRKKKSLRFRWYFQIEFTSE